MFTKFCPNIIEIIHTDTRSTIFNDTMLMVNNNLNMSSLRSVFISVVEQVGKDHLDNILMSIHNNIISYMLCNDQFFGLIDCIKIIDDLLYDSS